MADNQFHSVYSTRTSRKEPVALVLQFHLSAAVSVMAGSIFEGKIDRLSARWALRRAVFLLSGKVFLCIRTRLPGVLIAALLNI